MTHGERKAAADCGSLQAVEEALWGSFDSLFNAVIFHRAKAGNHSMTRTRITFPRFRTSSTTV